MSPEDKKQIELLEAYKPKEIDIMEDLLYIECIECHTLVKVANKRSYQRRKFCDSCKSAKQNNYPSSNKHNKDIGWKPYQQIRSNK